MEEALHTLHNPAIEALLERRDYHGDGDTGFEKVKNGFYRVETFTPQLLAAMEAAAQAQ